jgi:hypothetical protein
MEIKKEPKDNNSDLENFNINVNITRPKSVSFEITQNNEKNNIQNYKRTRFYSENIPSNFVPKLKPIKPEIKPTPMKLNHINYKRNPIIINEILETNENIFASFEKEEFSDLSETDSDFSEDEYEKLNFEIIEKNNKPKKNKKIKCKYSFIQNLKKEMNKVKNEMKKERTFSYNDYDSIQYKKTIYEFFLENENKNENGKNKIKKGFCILDVLKKNSPHIDFYKQLSFDKEFIL